MQYTPLPDTNSTPRNSIGSIDHIQLDRTDHLCRVCRNKLMTKQIIIHTPIECLSQRCQLLESEVIRLKDRDIKSNLQIKELGNKMTALENATQGLITPKQQQAAPYSFGIGHKVRHQLKKTESEDIPAHKLQINYDNILQPKGSNSREHVGLFGSPGALSQQR